MEILIPYFNINGTDSYPDDYRLFSSMEKLKFNNQNYWLCNYAGKKELETGVNNCADYRSYLKAPLLPIVIDQVTNILTDFDDSDTQYTVKENTDCIATGKLAIPKQNFRVPFIRTDTGRKAYMIAAVDELGNFTITLNFKTSGEWLVNTELLNSELPKAVFSIAEHKFKVV